MLHSEMNNTSKVAATRHDQQQHQAGIRRIILGTTIMESSITIPGVTVILDTMICKVASYNPEYDHNTLTSAVISASQADQRAGRVGRSADGIVSRAMTNVDFERLRKSRPYSTPKSTMLESALTILSDLALQDRLEWTFRGQSQTAFDFLSKFCISTGWWH